MVPALSGHHFVRLVVSPVVEYGDRWASNGIIVPAFDARISICLPFDEED